LLDLLIPRFVIEQIAFIENEAGDLEQVCREIDLLPDEQYDKIFTVKAFNFFGYGLFPKIINKDDANDKAH